jgi:hypothetical protein
MLSPLTEKKYLQAIVALACIVPIFAGFGGMIEGPGLLGENTAISLDSHFRYLSGLLLGLGVAFLCSIPRIEQRRPRIRLLTMLVVIGGMGRLAGFFETGTITHPMLAALCMELIVTPLICLWQHRIAHRLGV